MKRLELAAWGLALLAALLAGGIASRRALAARSRVPFAAAASSDFMLAAVTSGGTSAPIVEALAALPREESVLFVADDRDGALAKQLTFALSALSLPRPVGLALCRRDATGLESATVTVPLDPAASISSLLLLDPAPPAAARPLGGELALLRIAPTPASRPWTPYCSQLRSPSS